MNVRVIVAGATGWAGSALSRGILATPDLHLVGAVSRSAAGKPLGKCVVSATCAEALKTQADVFFEYTRPQLAKANVAAALEAGLHVVVGTSGLTDEDYAELALIAKDKQRGLLAVGNFAITVVLLHKFAEMAAKFIPHFEVIDSAKESKPDAPSGTARELAWRLGNVRKPELSIPPNEARGMTLNGVQVHSVRVPGFVIGLEAVFGMKDQRLHLRHEAGSSAEPYVDGALLAIRKVGTLTGLHRGLDKVIDW